MNVRSFITSHADGAKVSAGDLLKIGGIAFDGGYGITEVVYSTDDGKTWRGAELGPDLGKYSFRQWSAKLVLKKGSYTPCRESHQPHRSDAACGCALESGWIHAEQHRKSQNHSKLGAMDMKARAIAAAVFGALLFGMTHAESAPPVLQSA